MFFWKDEYIEDWAHFEKFITELNSPEWIFRGQRSASWDIRTSFYRELNSLSTIDKSLAFKYENSIVQDFTGSYKLYDNLYEFPKSDDIYTAYGYTEDYLEKLSILQHYGAPTRLLDWTFSPYIGVYFGLDGANENFCVYALNSWKLQEMAKARLQEHYFKFKNNINLMGNAEFVFTYVPKQTNRRIRVQQGLFLVPSVLDKTIDDILLNNYEVIDGITTDGSLVGIKFIFNQNAINSCWKKLQQMNITPETIYPGFEGFCKSLKLNILSPK
ncbi:FRG domain-containing protein [Bacillus cereus]|nr:FRG domain-containing protein [Bacillus cereus]